MIAIHTFKHLIAAMMAFPRHVVHHAGMATAHAVSSQASGVGKPMVLVVLMVMRKRSLVLWERDLRKRILCSYDRCGLGGVRDRLALALSDGASFASALDSLVAVLVVGSKVLEELTV